MTVVQHEGMLCNRHLALGFESCTGMQCTGTGTPRRGPMSLLPALAPAPTETSASCSGSPFLFPGSRPLPRLFVPDPDHLRCQVLGTAKECRRASWACGTSSKAGAVIIRVAVNILARSSASH